MRAATLEDKIRQRVRAARRTLDRAVRRAAYEASLLSELQVLDLTAVGPRAGERAVPARAASGGASGPESGGES